VKKSGILNKDICEVIASMGHQDILTICDAGFPIPESARRIDLAIIPGIPSFLQVAGAVRKDLEIQQIILAEELSEKNPGLEKEIKYVFSGIDVVYKSHEEFKKLSIQSRAFIRTGECTPFSNVIIVSGVIF